jgi:hypothetical protein
MRPRVDTALTIIHQLKSYCYSLWCQWIDFLCLPQTSVLGFSSHPWHSFLHLCLMFLDATNITKKESKLVSSRKFWRQSDPKTHQHQLWLARILQPYKNICMVYVTHKSGGLCLFSGMSTKQLLRLQEMLNIY